MKLMSIQLAFSFLAVSVAFGMAEEPVGAGSREPIHHRPNPHESNSLPAGSIGVITPAITYHGGAVTGTPTVYFIWYGNWNQQNGSDNAGGQSILRDFVHGLSNSPYYKINTSYGAPTGLVNRSTREYTDNYSHGASLTDAGVQAVVSGALAGGQLGSADPMGLYFVLTSSDVAERSGFCTKYCGWHTAATIAGTNIKYAFIGNSARCLNSCAAQTVGPNGNAGVDGMVSVLAHELEESNTDPDPISGWADSGGAENGDKCAWTFGANLLGPANAQYNMTLPTISGGNRNYLVQRNLDAHSKCYVNYVTKAQ